MTTLIEQLANQMRDTWPDASIEFDPPGTSAGIWWIHAAIAQQRVEVEWRQTEGFGISVCDETSVDDAFSGPTTIVVSVPEALTAIRAAVQAASVSVV